MIRFLMVLVAVVGLSGAVQAQTIKGSGVAWVYWSPPGPGVQCPGGLSLINPPAPLYQSMVVDAHFIDTQWCCLAFPAGKTVLTVGQKVKWVAQQNALNDGIPGYWASEYTATVGYSWVYFQYYLQYSYTSTWVPYDPTAPIDPPIPD